MGYDDIAAAANALAEATGRERHDAAVILGSGLGDYASSRPGGIEVPFSDLPGFPVPKVEGHGGSVFSVDVDGAGVLLYSGRVHTYEGYDLNDVVFGVRTAAVAGCHTVLLTNAAGGVGERLHPGDLVVIKDHINLTGRNPLLGPNDDRLGPRFPDMSDAYSQELRAVILKTARDLGIEYKEGVYAWFLGPSYETPAEIFYAKRIGADLVGMSTVPEAIALNHAGVRVAGISLVTNLAAGIAGHPLSHEEVQETAAEAKQRFTALVDALIPELVKR